MTQRGHSARTAPIITLFIPGTPLKTTHLQKRASGVQNSGPWDPWLPVVKKSQLFARRGHGTRCAPLLHPSTCLYSVAQPTGWILPHQGFPDRSKEGDRGGVGVHGSGLQPPTSTTALNHRKPRSGVRTGPSRSRPRAPAARRPTPRSCRPL